MNKKLTLPITLVTLIGFSLLACQAETDSLGQAFSTLALQMDDHWTRQRQNESLSSEPLLSLQTRAGPTKIHG